MCVCMCFGCLEFHHRQHCVCLGLSSAPVGYIGKVLEGFKLSKETLKPKQVFPPPRIPRDFKPVHQRPAAQKDCTDSSRVQIKLQPQQKKQLDANVRKAMLGELGGQLSEMYQYSGQKTLSIKNYTCSLRVKICG